VPQICWYTLYGQELKTNMAARFENVDESYTGRLLSIKQVSKMPMQVYSCLSPKNTFKKPNLGESQMKTFFFLATLLLL
jgi:hypothetical protein